MPWVPTERTAASPTIFPELNELLAELVVRVGAILGGARRHVHPARRERPFARRRGCPVASRWRRRPLLSSVPVLSVGGSPSVRMGQLEPPERNHPVRSGRAQRL